MIVVALFLRMSKEIKVLSWPDRIQFQIILEKEIGVLRSSIPAEEEWLNPASYKQTPLSCLHCACADFAG